MNASTSLVRAAQASLDHSFEIVPAGSVAIVPQRIPTSAVDTFDYSTMPANKSELVRERTERIRASIKRGIRTAVEIGQELIAVKEVLDHGQFGRWLRAEFSWTDRTARNHMRVAEVFGTKSEIISDLPPATIYRLAASSTPENIVNDVVAQLERGDQVDVDRIEARIQAARQDRKFAQKAAKRSQVWRVKQAKRRAAEEAARNAREQKRQLERDAMASAVANWIAEFGASAAALAELFDRDTWWDVSDELRKQFVALHRGDGE
jgi:hypothetical protein